MYKKTHLRKMDYKKFQASLPQTGEQKEEKKNEVGKYLELESYFIVTQQWYSVTQLPCYVHFCLCTPVVMLCNRDQRANLTKLQIFFLRD